MALSESTALGVLAGETDVISFQQQRTERERLCSRPIQLLARLEHLLARRNELCNLRMDVEALGDGSQRLTDRIQNFSLHAGWLDASELRGALKSVPSRF